MFPLSLMSAFGVRVVRDTATPDLKRLGAAAKNLRPMFKAVGVAVVSIGKRAFAESQLRPNAWAQKKDGTIATLKDTTTLWRSVRVVVANANSVVVGSDRKYAAIHQLGGKSRPMPRRGYLPFSIEGKPTPFADKTTRQVINAWIKARGGTSAHLT